MSMNSEIAALLEEHFGQDEEIAYDGVVDEETFVDTAYRVMFLLKDVNNDGRVENWKEYMDFIRRQAQELKAGWHNVCRWMEVLYRPDADFCDCLNAQQNNYNIALQKHMLNVSIVNIKKTMGCGVNLPNVLDEQLDNIVKDKDLRDMLIEQIGIIQPKLVICGGTFEHACTLHDSPKVSLLKCGARYFIIKNESLYLEFYHPSAHIKTNVMFCYAKIVFPEAIEKMKEFGLL